MIIDNKYSDGMAVDEVDEVQVAMRGNATRQSWQLNTSVILWLVLPHPRWIFINPDADVIIETNQQ